MNALELKIPPLVVTLVLAIAMWLLSRAMPFAAAGGALSVAMAIALALIGGGIGLAGILAFRRSRTTANPVRPQNASALVTAGVYRITRNPMYLGILLALAGWALFLFNPWSIIGPVLFVAYITRFQIVPEERALLSLFGERYVAYRARVRRWL